MHTIKLNVGDSAYTHLMFLLKNLNTSEIQVVEDIVQDKDKSSEVIDMSAYKIETFKSIQDPLKWQQEIRAEWS
ncbi:hypothetical protein NG754_09635 [Aliarcobacter cryaerophilus]|uniref:hypothetical protein n=1 Tax=Aliarcobacter cryaerophilus TaxID=28198 RepID=UPI003DA49EC8